MAFIKFRTPLLEQMQVKFEPEEWINYKYNLIERNEA